MILNNHSDTAALVHESTFDSLTTSGYLDQHSIRPKALRSFQPFSGDIINSSPTYCNCSFCNWYYRSLSTNKGLDNHSHPYLHNRCWRCGSILSTLYKPRNSGLYNYISMSNINSHMSNNLTSSFNSLSPPYLITHTTVPHNNELLTFLQSSPSRMHQLNIFLPSLSDFSNRSLLPHCDLQLNLNALAEAHSDMTNLLSKLNNDCLSYYENNLLTGNKLGNCFLSACDSSLTANCSNII